MAFSIKNLLNEETLKNATDASSIVKIDYQKLVPNEKNIYHIAYDETQDLADDIEYNGLLQNIVVKPLDDKTYAIVAGHRRWNAIKELVENRGLSQFASVPCLVLDKDESEEETLLKLHTTNLLARSITEYEKMEGIKELKSIYKILASRGKKPKGKIRDLISEQVGLRPTQVQKYMTIGEKASEEILNDLRNNVVTVDEAYKQIKAADKPVEDEYSTIEPTDWENGEDGDKCNKSDMLAVSETAAIHSDEYQKEVKKKVVKLKKFLEESGDKELFNLVRQMEIIIINRF